MKIIFEKQSPQKLIQVLELENGGRYLLLEGRTEIHSEYDPEHVLLEPLSEHYWNIMSWFCLTRPLDSVLIIGMGAGTIARQIDHYLPNLAVEGIEIDDDITQVGKEFFHLPQHAIIHHTDAETFLNSTQKKYDYIILDAFFDGNLAVPLCTKEFIALCKSHLTSGGVLGINYLDEQPVSSYIRTGVAPNFTHRYRVCIPGTYNYVMFVSDRQIDFSTFTAPDEQSKSLKNFITRTIEQI